MASICNEESGQKTRIFVPRKAKHCTSRMDTKFAIETAVPPAVHRVGVFVHQGAFSRSSRQ